MKPFIAWLKSNWLIAALVAAILVIIPGSYFGSQMWGESIRAKQEKAAAAELQKVQAAKIDYAIPSYDPKIQAVSHKSEPNKVLTDWFAQKRAELKGEAEGVLKRAVDFNKGVGPDAASVFRSEHTPIVPNLFPDGVAKATKEIRDQMGAEAFDAKTPEEKAKLIAGRRKEIEKVGMDAFEDAILGKRAKNPYLVVLESARAGDRIDPVRLNETISDLRTREIEKITANKRELTVDEAATLNKTLADRRLAEMLGHARNISVYAGMDCLPNGTNDGVSIVSGRIYDIDLNWYFLNQWDLWVLEDIFSTIRLANSTPDGTLVGVDQGVVKRVESIVLKQTQGVANDKDQQRRDDLAATGQSTDPAALVLGTIPLDFTVSHTGRSMGTWNKLYDVRRAEITVVVASDRLQDYLQAITRTNFMTVTDLDLTEVDTWNDMRLGYFYGPQHVVRARIGIESIWLREWTQHYMPTDIRGMLGAPADLANPTAGAK